MTLQALGKLGTVALVPCEHCGSQRMKMNLDILRAELLREPTPLLLQMVIELTQFYGAWVPLFVCSACSCVTADSRAHSH
jgi:hypothetical protein